MIPINGYDREVYDGNNNAYRVNLVAGDIAVNSTATVTLYSTPTLYAVVNQGAATDPKIFIGLTTSVIGSAPTLFAVVNTSAAGQASIVVDGPVAINGNVTLDPGSKTGIVGNVTLSDPKGYIGLVSINGPVRLYASDGTAFNHSGGNMLVNVQNFAVGQFGGNATNATNLTSALAFTQNQIYDGTYWVRQTGDTANGTDVDVTRLPALTAGANFIGLVTVANTVSTSFSGNVTLDPGSKTGIVGNVTLSDSKGFIGLVTATGNVGVLGNVTLSDSKNYIGLVTAWSRNAGTTKTIIQLPIGLGNNSISTVATPTNAQSINITHLILNSNITTEIALKSGVTYLTGNATLGISIFPGGGFVMNGSPDSPVWRSLPSGAFIVEKRDGGGTVSKIAGHVMYFDE